jgi:hypothetical protein
MKDYDKWYNKHVRSPRAGVDEETFGATVVSVLVLAALLYVLLA